MPKRIRDPDSTVSIKDPKKKSKNRDTQKWRAVEGTEFLEGLDEDGFMGLEELDAPKMFSSSSIAIAKPETVSLSIPAISKEVADSDAARSAVKAKLRHRSSLAPAESKAAVPKAVPQESCENDGQAATNSGISKEAAEDVREGFRRYQERMQAQKTLRNEVKSHALSPI